MSYKAAVEGNKPPAYPLSQPVSAPVSHPTLMITLKTSMIDRTDKLDNYYKQSQDDLSLFLEQLDLNLGELNDKVDSIQADMTKHQESIGAIQLDIQTKIELLSLRERK
jgi:peptidoglycan hydrolase CwlO-like protein